MPYKKVISYSEENCIRGPQKLTLLKINKNFPKSQKGSLVAYFLYPVNLDNSSSV